MKRKKDILEWYEDKQASCDFGTNCGVCKHERDELSALIDRLIEGAPSTKSKIHEDDLDTGWDAHCELVEQWKVEEKEGL